LASDGEPRAEERRDRVVDARDDREPGRQAELRRRSRQEAAEHRAGADPRRRRTGIETGEPGIVRRDRVCRVLERSCRDPAEAKGHVIPRGEEPRRPRGDIRRRDREAPGRPEERHVPAVTAERGGDGGRLRAGSPIEPRDRVPHCAAVIGRGHEGRPLAHAADGDHVERAFGGSLRDGDRRRPAERVPPRVGILLGASGLAVEQERVRGPGLAAQPAIERGHACLGGRGPEVEGKDCARVQGRHGGQW